MDSHWRADGAGVYIRRECMSVLILIDADDAESATILTDEHGDNRVFDSAEQADDWCCRNGGQFLTVQFIEIE